VSVLVTGGAGFVGSYVVRDLLAAGETVVVYDATVSKNTLDLLLPESEQRTGIVLEQGRIGDGLRLLRVCDEHDVSGIIHLASPLTTDVASDPSAGVADICSGTATVFEVARARGIGRVVWASSVAVFGPARRYQSGPLADDAPHYPETLYGSCKSLCEQMARSYYARDQIGSIGLRLTVVYGPGRLRGYMTIPSDVIRRVALGEAVEVPFGDQTINWQYVEDVASMFTSALFNGPADGAYAVNTSGEPRTFRDAAAILQRLARDVPVSIAAGSFADDPDRTDAPYVYDDSFLRTRGRFEPKFPFERGVEATYRGYREMIARDGGRAGVQ